MNKIREFIDALKSGNIENLKKYSWLVVLLLILFAAKTVSDIAITAVDHSLTPLTAPKEKEKPRIYLPRPNIKNILSFNIFNPAFQPELGPGADSLQGAIPNTFRLDLEGTIVFEDSKRSLADLIQKGQRETLTVQENDIILTNQAKVIKIEYDRVYLQNLTTQGFEYVALPQDEEAEKPSLSVGPTGAGIKTTGEGQFQIGRTLIKDALSPENIGKTLTDASSVFVLKGGHIDGVHITSIRPGSFFEQLGIQANDILKSVNGQKIDNYQAPLALFTQLRKNVDTISEPVTIEVLRNGRPVTMTYRVEQ